MSNNDIRRFLQIVEGVELTEAQDYNSMFNDIRKLVAVYKDDHLADIINQTISEIIPLVKQNLKKNDRVVWFLRLYKQLLINDMRTFINDKSRSILSQKERDAFMKPVDDFQERYKQDITAKGGDKAWSSSLTDGMNFIGSAVMPSDSGKIRNLLERFAHYFSLPIPEIQNVVFQYQPMAAVMNTFRGLEVEWQKKAKETFQHDPEEGQVIIKFPDGFVWWLLWTGSCSREGKAMGHCGNVPSERPGDRLLSLRKMSKVGNVEMTRPSLTFILHKDGYLGEMKGRANQKPDAKYHPYIVELLKNNIIKGIRGGGYAPQNNFSMNDLDDDTRQELVDLKPELGTVLDLFKREGATPRVLHKMEEDYGIPIKGETFDRNGVAYGVIEKHKNIFDAAESITDDSRSRRGENATATEWVINFLHDGGFLDIGHVIADRNNKLEFLNELSPENRKQVGEWLATQYPDSVPEDYNPNDADDIMSLQNDVESDELDRCFDDAYNDGYRMGGERQIYDAFWEEVHKNPYLFNADNPDEDINYESKVVLAAPITEIIERIEADKEGWEYDQTWLNIPDLEEYKFKIEQPYYGWDSYDDEGARNRFIEMLFDEGIVKDNKIK